MKAAFYRFLLALSQRIGLWVFRVGAWGIASGYFLFFPGRVAVGVRFYGALYPERGRLYRLWCTWKQFHSFPHVFLDRFLLAGGQTIKYTHDGWEYLEEAVNSETGGIILMSHVGNWEVASRILQERGRENPRIKLLLYLGKKYKEQIERTQKEGLVRSGVRIIAVEQDGGSPMDLVEGINFLKAGGLVSLTGDRRWHEDQRTVMVRFLGHEAFLPETPFIFALLSDSPLFIFFACRTGSQTYHFQVLPPIVVRAKDRQSRGDAIRRAAQFYADRLEETVRQHPFEWFHFEPFIGGERYQSPAAGNDLQKDDLPTA
ncbi:MAG: lysophospholipid acyltransferase family protein [Syntrophales bacterium]|jgi:predicted LPLAT superfamily acyltransferase|nr:lysophospholipid acyltransferase family protein [Syntrophales bacterium]